MPNYYYPESEQELNNHNDSNREQHENDLHQNRSIPDGMQLVSEVAIKWLCDNHPEIYDGFYERVDK